ncbi:hypothetical protein ACGFOU_06570 [Streptomyces sp. NPDC048595]
MAGSTVQPAVNPWIVFRAHRVGAAQAGFFEGLVDHRPEAVAMAETD